MENGDLILMGSIPFKEYSHIHYWLKRKYGKAYCCENPDCCGKSKNYHWSKINGKMYEKNRDNFKMLCASCHAKYDETEEKCQKKSITLTGRKLSEEHKRKMSIASKGKPKSEEHKRKLKGRKMSEEARLKMSNAAKGKIKNSKLVPEQILQIKQFRREDLSYTLIAKKFNVSINTIARVIKNKTYQSNAIVH